MDLLHITRFAWRRWYVFLPLLILLGVAALRVPLTSFGVDASYRASLNGFLYVPSTVQDEFRGNPYLAGNTYPTVSRTLAVTLNGPAVAGRLLSTQQVERADFFTDPSTPVVQVQVQATTAGVAVQGTLQAVELLQEQLLQQQLAVGAPEDRLIKFQILQQPLVEPSSSSALRARAALLVLALLLSAVVAAIVHFPLVRLAERERHSGLSALRA